MLIFGNMLHLISFDPAGAADVRIPIPDACFWPRSGQPSIPFVQGQWI